MKKGKIVIVISGGIVQRVISDHVVDVHIIDHDNANSTEDFEEVREMFETPVFDLEVMDKESVEEVIQENLKDYDSLKIRNGGE
jgi:hypothetical protein